MAWNPFQKSSWQPVQHALDPHNIQGQIQHFMNDALNHIQSEVNKASQHIEVEANSVGKAVKDESYKVQGEVASNVNRVGNEAKKLAEDAYNQLKGEGQAIVLTIKTEGNKVITEIKDQATNTFHKLSDELKQQVTSEAFKYAKKKALKYASLASNFLPSDLSLSLPVVSFSLSGIGTIQENGQSGIANVASVFGGLDDLKWNYTDVHKFIMDLTQTGVDMTITVSADFEVPVFSSLQVGVSAGWSLNNLVLAIDKILDEVGLNK